MEIRVIGNKSRIQSSLDFYLQLSSVGKKSLLDLRKEYFSQFMSEELKRRGVDGYGKKPSTDVTLANAVNHETEKNDNQGYVTTGKHVDVPNSLEVSSVKSAVANKSSPLDNVFKDTATSKNELCNYVNHGRYVDESEKSESGAVNASVSNIPHEKLVDTKELIYVPHGKFVDDDQGSFIEESIHYVSNGRFVDETSQSGYSFSDEIGSSDESSFFDDKEDFEFEEDTEPPDIQDNSFIEDDEGFEFEDEEPENISEEDGKSFEFEDDEGFEFEDDEGSESFTEEVEDDFFFEDNDDSFEFEDDEGFEFEDDEESESFTKEVEDNDNSFEFEDDEGFEFEDEGIDSTSKEQNPSENISTTNIQETDGISVSYEEDAEPWDFSEDEEDIMEDISEVDSAPEPKKVDVVPKFRSEISMEDEGSGSVDVPSDLREFLRQHPCSPLDYVLKFYSKKEVDKQLALGRVYKKKGKLMI